MNRQGSKKIAIKDFEDKFYSLPLWCRQGFMTELNGTGISIVNDNVDKLTLLDLAKEKVDAIIYGMGILKGFVKPQYEVRYTITSPGNDSLELGANLGSEIKAEIFYDFIGEVE